MAQSTLSLEDCMQYAISNSTQMRIEQADRNDERVARRDAILELFTPIIEGGTSVANIFGRSEDPETNTFSNTTTFTNDYSLSASMMLFDGFKAVNNMKISKTMKQMGINHEQLTKDQICLATMEAFCNVAYYKSLIEFVDNQLKTSEATLKLIQRQAELGQKSESDVLQIEADFAEKQYQLIEAQNNYAESLISLKDIMFWPNDKPFEIRFSADDFALSNIGLLTDTTLIINNAQTDNASVLIAKDKMENARLELNTARWNLAPKLSIIAGWSTEFYNFPGSNIDVPSFSEQFKNNRREAIQLSLNIPIYSRLSSHSNISRKKSNYVRATAEYEQSLKDVENEVLRAIKDRNGAETAYIQADKLEKAQETLSTINLRKFEQGLISSIDYQTISNKLLESQARKLNALLKYFIKCSVVRYYNGESYIEQVSKV